MKLGIYKRGQGTYTRLGTAFGISLIAGLGCLRLYDQLRAANLSLWVETLVPAVLFVLLAILIFFLVNKPNIANFMVDAEGEMKKVSWSSRKEIFVSTVVVILVVIVLAAFLGTVDLGFSLFFSEIIGI